MRAALDLFAERGYENTTVAEIAERAGLTKTTFFRHFTDKREVLFVGQELHNRLLADGIAASPDSATPLQAAIAGLDALTDSFPEDRRELGARLRVIIAANGELQERAVFKRVGHAMAVTEALRQRGVPDPTAGLAADLAVRAYYQAFEAWADTANRQTLTELTHQALDELRAAVATLG